jgi:Flp pilus assembly protein TadG
VSAFRLMRALRRFVRDKRGLGAVEFAMTAPFMILLYIGGAQLMDAISAYRKVVQADRTLADVTTQYVSVTPTDLDNIITGAKQVMAPFPNNSASMIITEIAFDNNRVPSIVWSRSNDGTTLKLADLKLSNDISQPGSYIVLSQIIYRYKPSVAAKLVGPLTFTDHIYMNPRRSNSVDCPLCT